MYTAASIYKVISDSTAVILRTFMFVILCGRGNLYVLPFISMIIQIILRT